MFSRPIFTVFGTANDNNKLTRVMTTHDGKKWDVNDSINNSLIPAHYTAGCQTRSGIVMISSFDAHHDPSHITPSSVTHDGNNYTSGNNVKYSLQDNMYKYFRHTTNSGVFDVRSIATGVIASPSVIQRHLVVTAATCRNGTLLFDNGDGRFNTIIPLVTEHINYPSLVDTRLLQRDLTHAKWNGIAIGNLYIDGQQSTRCMKDNIIVVVGTACDYNYIRPCSIVFHENKWKTMYINDDDIISPDTLTALDNRLPWNDVTHVPELHCYCAVADLSDTRYHHNDIDVMYSFAETGDGLHWRHTGKLPNGNRYHLPTFIRGFMVVFTDENIDHSGTHGFVIGERITGDYE